MIFLLWVVNMMDLSAKYAYEVYKQKSFSAAAKALFVSQPALSACISRLEKEMGIRIFDRTRQPLTLTPQGRVYIETVEEIMQNENDMWRKIRALSNVQDGTITIGGSSYASYYLMSKICAAFHKKYPKIQVNLDLGNVGSTEVLWEKLENNKLDLMITYLNDRTEYITEPIFKERLVIAMHKQLKGAKELSHFALTHQEILTGNFPKEREIEDLSIFKDIEFIKYTGKGDTTRRMAQMLGDYKAAPFSIKNSRHSEMHYNLMCAGIGAVITTDSAIIQKQHNADDLLFFVPRQRESYRTIYITRKHGADDNPIINNFIQVAKSFYDLPNRFGSDIDP